MKKKLRPTFNRRSSKNCNPMFHKENGAVVVAITESLFLLSAAANFRGTSFRFDLFFIARIITYQTGVVKTTRIEVFFVAAIFDV